MTGRVHDQAIPNQTGSGQDIDTAFAETSRPVSANFSAKPDSRLIRDTRRADAVDVDAVDADAGTIGPPGPIISRAFRLDCKPAHERHLEDRKYDPGAGLAQA